MSRFKASNQGMQKGRIKENTTLRKKFKNFRPGQFYTFWKGYSRGKNWRFDVTLKSLSPLFFSILDEKLSHPWIQIMKKQLNFLRLSMGFDRKKIKI